MKTNVFPALLIFSVLFFGKNDRINQLIMITDPAPEFMVADMNQQIACAAKAGLIIKPPLLRIIRRPYPPGIRDGYAYMDINVITLTDYASYTILAHELGHILDGQSHRKGHPFFKDKKKLSIQAFADAVRDVILKECHAI